jgi:heparosan-N-sulfate-glucuronate 5-epimerase
MGILKEKFSNFAEYFGVRSSSYYHAETPANYDPSDFLAYYIDESGRADYPGPYDDDNIPMYLQDGQPYYFPILTCLCALAHLERYRRNDDENDRQFFLNVNKRLISDQNEEGAWLIDLPMKKYNLQPGWSSAMMQGLGISCLTRAHRLTGNMEYLEQARLAVEPFRKQLHEGGVTSTEDGRVFYEEYTSSPPHHVLNGFIFAMWGLYDLVRLIDDEEARRLFDLGLETLIAWLPRYDTGYWSLYHIGDGIKNPATVHYHRLHIEQLTVMHAITGNKLLLRYRDQWNQYLHGRFNAMRTLPHKLLWVASHS